ncbi:MAG: nicotinate-nucleotide adenylyltransferase [Gammaproteobacteria bacterium]
MIEILGGTFDPVHFGHLRPALDMRQALELEELRLVPCRQPPHRAQPYATPEQRLTMLQLATRGEPGLSIDERELRRAGPSYMVDTLLSLRAELGEDCSFALLIGMDALHGLASWHRWRELVDLCHVVVATRPGWRAPQSGTVAELVRERRVEDAASLRACAAGKLMLCPVTLMDVSASRIRALLAAGENPRYLLPDEVLEYIHMTDLYQK